MTRPPNFDELVDADLDPAERHTAANVSWTASSARCRSRSRRRASPNIERTYR